jgi:hypothetical protein
MDEVSLVEAHVDELEPGFYTVTNIFFDGKRIPGVFAMSAQATQEGIVTLTLQLNRFKLVMEEE